MNDNEIIKALECCCDNAKGCEECPFEQIECITNEENKLIEVALDLINSQKAEIERLQNDRIVIQLDDEVLLKDFKTEVKKEINTIKSEAYREFAERFKQKYDKPLFYLGSYEQFMCEVDNLVKELTESNE